MSQCATHRVPTGIVSMSLMAKSPCFVNFNSGAPRYLSSSVPISLHGLLSSTVSAVLLVAVAGTLSRAALACAPCSFSTSSVVLTLFFMAVPFVFAGIERRDALVQSRANFLDQLATHVVKLVAQQRLYVRAQITRRR